MAISEVIECPQCDGRGFQVSGDRTFECWRCKGAKRVLHQYRKLFRLQDVCGRSMRGGVVCVMDKDHKGRCSSVAWMCDGCGKMQRSAIAGNGADGEAYCFMCVRPASVFGQYEYAP